MTRSTPTDLLMAALVGLLFGLSPLTSSRTWLSTLLGIGAGVAFLVYRLRSERGRAYEFDAGLGTAALPGAAGGAPSAWICLVMFGAVYLPTLRWMYSEWTGSIWVNAHGVFVPVAMAYLAYSRLRLDPSREPDSSPWGFAFLVPGLALTILDMATRTRYLAAVGLVLCLPGLCLLLLGARRTRDLVVPLLVGIFMVPIPDTPPTHLWLRDATAMGVEPLLSLVGMPVLRDGTLIEIPSGAFVVSNACSGFATLYASIGVALVLVLSTRSWTRRALVLLSVVPLAVACNVLRVVLLVLLTHYLGPEILHTPVHEASGVATFMIVIFALWTLGSERFTLEAPA